MNNLGLTSHLRFILLAVITIIMASCSSSQQLFLDAAWEDANYEPRNYRKVVIFGFGKNMENNRLFEDEAVLSFKKKGIKAEAGHEIYDFEIEGELDRNDLKRYLFSLGYDGILVAAPIKNISTDDDDITDEELSAHKDGLYKFGIYYENRYKHLQEDTDHNSEKYSILEATFYYLMDYNDFDGGGLVWISHFKANTESDVKIEINQYTKIVVNSLFDDQVILK
ncbi:MAG: hypothetical protein OCD76_25510 [Reichenbachiella sp.]